MTFKQRKIFLLISLLILISDILFVTINYYSSKAALYQNFEETGQRQAKEFFLALDLVEGHMQQLAMLVASEKNIQNLFCAGGDAVLAEGGGAGGPVADAHRKELYGLVSERWQKLTKNYNVRQLHFHLGPGSTSFLRVHKPEKFGDNMDDVRYTIVDCNRDKKPTSGFEAGRVYAGIRGVVPVTCTTTLGYRKHAGALEAGTSFSLLLDYLKKQSQADFAVLLDLNLVRQKVWPAFLERMRQRGLIAAGEFIEATTDKALLLRYLDQEETNGGALPLFEDEHGSSYAAHRAPLRDYLGTVDPSTPDIGSVLIWFNADTQIAYFWRSVRINIIFAVIGFIILESLLVIAIRKITRGLQSIIEDQKEEIQRTHSRIIHCEKMASVGQLAAGVAHEINNPMGFISGNLRSLGKYLNKIVDFIVDQSDAIAKIEDHPDREIIEEKKKKLKLDFLIEDSRELIDESLDGAERVRNIVENLKSFSNVDRNEIQTRNINDILDRTLTVIQHQLGNEIIIEKNYRELPEITCYPCQLSQLFTNILINAAQAMQGDGTIKIRSWHEDECLYISISDSGHGIDQSNLNQIFNPFFTTRPIGQGQGLGLSVAWDVAQAHDGSIAVESELGKGATFTVQIPVNTGLEALGKMERLTKKS